MKRLLFTVVVGCAFILSGEVRGRSFSPITLVTHTSCTNAPTGCTTPVVNTTGATLIVLAADFYVLGGAGTVSDSNSNTWIALTQFDGAGTSATLFYCAPCTVGAGQTFTISGATNYPVLSVQAFSGTTTTGTFDGNQNGATGSLTTLQTGSVTPSEANALIVSSAAWISVSSATINSSFTRDDYNDYHSGADGSNVGGAMAWLVQTAATAVNPTWTLAATTTTTVNIAAFKPAGSSPSGPPPAIFGSPVCCKRGRVYAR